MRLAQIMDAKGGRAVVATEGGESRTVNGVETIYALAMEALAKGDGLGARVAAHGLGASVDLAAALAEGRVLTPIDHPDPAHLLVTGTGLTHLGSAEGRDKMHKDLSRRPPKLTDSMKMFRIGLEGGKPAAGAGGVQPEWFYKGDGSIVVAPGEPLPSPGFALDGGEEPEVAGIYVIGADGTPCRVGFALGNEFSDHVTERQNYLYLAHSKLRACVVRAGAPDRRSARRRPRHLAHPPRRQGALGEAVPLRRGRTCRTPSPTSSRTISSTRCSAGRATCTSTSSAPRPCRSPTASRPSRATCSRSNPPPFGLPLRNRLATVAVQWPKVRVL